MRCLSVIAQFRMDRAIPVGSKLLHRMELAELQKKHQAKLKIIQSTNSAYNHLKEEAVQIKKNKRFLKDKEDTIKKDNKKLAEKIMGFKNVDPSDFAAQVGLFKLTRRPETLSEASLGT